jgi:hypothetical protein
LKLTNEDYSPPSYWTVPVKPAISNRELILSRIGGTLSTPGVILRKCWIWLTEASSHFHTRANQFVQHHLSIWSVVMTIDADHVIVPTRIGSASAKMLAEILGVPWAGAGPFSAVYVNDGLTLDFVETEGSFSPHHYCFRVEEQEFNAILGRLKRAGISYRSTLNGPDDLQVNREYCNSSLCWNEPDGHQWEIRTVARLPQAEMSI